jgi:hypothetical protein
MKIHCTRCGEPFEPSPRRFVEELSMKGAHYCSRKCRSPVQPERPVLVPGDLHTGGQELHLRVERKRDLRRLIRALADVDCELVGTRPTMKGRAWSLQWDRPSAARAKEA